MVAKSAWPVWKYKTLNGLRTKLRHVHGLDVAPHLFEPLGTSNPKAPMIHIEPGESIDRVSRKRTLEFAGTLPAEQNPYAGLDFTINGMLYEEDSVQQEVAMGDAEEWILKVGDMNHGGTEGHPFHIHVNHNDAELSHHLN